MGKKAEQFPELSAGAESGYGVDTFRRSRVSPAGGTEGIQHKNDIGA
jgi:hypothetical protein